MKPLPSSLAVVLIAAVTATAQNDLTDIPTPDPVAEQALMQIIDGAAVNLFAANPDFGKPTQINFDCDGGLWIASSNVYPQIQPGEVADDKIVVLRDTDGDGVSDSRTVFADGLLIPTGVLPDGPDAAYIADSTQLVYMTDTDGDGRADTREILLSGFGTEDTHHLIHTLRFGPDGCVYFNQSIYIHSRVDTPFGTRSLDGGGIWRFRPTTRSLEVFCKGFLNPWGHVFDPAGESFVTDGAFFEGINYTFPDAVFVTSPGATRWLKGMNPGSPKHCGLEILSGTHIPPQWAGSLVTSDFRSHRVCRFEVKPSASGYLSRQQPEIITTPHVAFRPIDARMGPDGALYVADWYNPIIQHGEVDFRDERRDRSSGRIWRVSFPDRELDRWPNVTDAVIDELLDLLTDPALSVAQFARQELWNRVATDSVQTLAAMKAWASKDPATRTNEYLWLIEVAQAPMAEELLAIASGFGDIEPARQRTSLRSLWRNRLSLPSDAPERNLVEQFVIAKTTDDDPRVRMEAVVAAGQVAGSDVAIAVLDATRKDIDDNLDYAIWQSIRSLDAKADGGSIVQQIDWTDRTDQLAYAVSAIATPAAAEVATKMIESGNVDAPLVRAVASAGDAGQLGRVAKTLLAGEATRSIETLRPLLDRTGVDGIVPAGVGAMLASVIDSADDVDGAVASMATTWKVSDLEPIIVTAIGATDNGDLRRELIAALGTFESKSAIEKIADLASSDDVDTRIAATAAMVGSRPQVAATLAVKLLADDDSAPAASTLIVEMLGRKGLPWQIASALKNETIGTDVARALLRSVRSAGGYETLETAIRTAGKLDDASWELSPELVARLTSKVRSSGSATAGEAIYRREALQCIACHAIGSAGGLVGPNLISVGGASQIDYIIESLIAPSEKLKEGYSTLMVVTDEGQVISGIVIGETDEALRLRLADGKEVQIDVDAIVQEKPGNSLMPAGLVDSLTEDELVDLVAFLSAMGRTPEFTVSTRPLVRSMETLVYSPEANRRLNRTSTDTAASDDPAMQWKLVTTTVDGKLPVAELDQFKQHKQTPPTSFIRWTIDMPATGNVQLELPGDGIEAWVDGKPTPVWNLSNIELDAGNHTVVLAIDRTKQTEPFTIGQTGDAR